MTGTILTPSAIWGGFRIDGIPEAKVIGEKRKGDVALTRLLIDGRNTSGGQVKIYAVAARSVQLSVMPAILIVQDVKVKPSDELAIEFAKKGYYALSVDLAGQDEDREFYTVYPEELSYAEYRNVKNSLYEVGGDVQHTCWYEWTSVVKYALKYVSSQPCVTKVGAVGVAESATALWQAAGTENTLSAAVFLMNAGWRAYRGNYKFGANGAPQFSEDMMKYVAGVEAQSYSAHINCPCLVLCPALSGDFDCDRAYDTVARIEADVYTAVDYTLNFRNHLENSALTDMCLFFAEFLLKANRDSGQLPGGMDLKCECADGGVSVDVSADGNNLQTIFLYASEETENPAFRAWNKITAYEKSESVFKFRYEPYSESGVVFFFAKAEYKNKFSLSSNIVAKRFKAEEIKKRHKDNILYSGRIPNSESVFTSGFDDEIINGFYTETSSENEVKVKKGPMDIEGVYSEKGLMSFKVNAKKDKPGDDAILMFDLYTKEDGVVTVKLVAEGVGYFASVSVAGGGVWHNIRLEMPRFKTEEGRILKSYSKVNAIAFKCSGKYLINNVLWV